MFPTFYLPSSGCSITPADLFTGGIDGVWFDPSDFTTMFQDEAGTVPVTGTGQNVRKILDKSGNGHDMTTGGFSTRIPVLQQDGNGKYYLDYFNDRLASAVATFPNTTKLTLWLGYGKQLSTAFGRTNNIIRFDGQGSGSGVLDYVYIRSIDSETAANCNYSTGVVDGASNLAFASTAGGIYVNTTDVVTATLDMTLASNPVDIRVDGQNARANSSGSTAAPLQNMDLGGSAIYRIGQSESGLSSNTLQGKVYGAIMRCAATSLSDIECIEEYMAEKTGVTLV